MGFIIEANGSSGMNLLIAAVLRLRDSAGLV
jgi:hypothetical protein